MAKTWDPKPYRPFPEDLQLYNECPSYDGCSCNRCPLDAEYSVLRRTIVGDTDWKCRAEKPTRLRIVEEARAAGSMAVDYLPYGGLTAGEWKGKKAVAGMSEEQKRTLAERGREYRRKQAMAAQPHTSPNAESSDAGLGQLVSGDDCGPEDREDRAS
ncbi:hypothetical protein LLH23_04865 [bacterium]|nr:hypothetical protein [bacterium]